MVKIKSKICMRRLLDTFSADNLMDGFVWSTSSEGALYWCSLYDDLFFGRPVTPERIEEAKGRIRKMLGIIDPSKEAEWE